MDSGRITYSGISDLDAALKEEMKNICEHEYDKLKRNCQIQHFEVHLKTHQTDGDQKKFSFHINCKTDQGVIIADKDHDWDFHTALRKSLDSVHEQVRK